MLNIKKSDIHPFYDTADFDYAFIRLDDGHYHALVLNHYDSKAYDLSAIADSTHRKTFFAMSDSFFTNVLPKLVAVDEYKIV